LVAVHHSLSRHPDGSSCPRRIDPTESLEKAARWVSTSLPARLREGTLRLEGERIRSKRLAACIAESLRDARLELMRQGGVDRLLPNIDSWVHSVLQGAWLELPKLEPPPASSRVRDSLGRVASAATFPLGMCIIHQFKLLPPSDEQWGWIAALIWAGLSVGTWLDPSLPDRLKTVGQARDLLKGG
jgi:hypothetical protein